MNRYSKRTLVRAHRMPRIPFAVACLIATACASPPRLQLPKVGTVGDLPPAADTLTIEVQRDGTLSCDGRTLSLAEFAARVTQEATTHLGEKIEFLQTSDLKVVIAADGEAPFGALAPMHTVLFRSSPAVYQVFYAVRSESDGEAGALALFLPHDIGGHFEPWLVPVPIRIGFDAGASTPAALWPHGAGFRRANLEGCERPIGVAAANDVPFAFVLQVADAVLRAGTDNVVLEWPQDLPDGRRLSDTSRSVPELVRAIGPVQRTTSIRFHDHLLAANAPPLPPRPRVHGAVTGLTETRRVNEDVPPPEPPKDAHAVEQSTIEGAPRERHR